MGFYPSKPEFVTVLANKTVTSGENIILQCQANTEDVTTTWGKDGSKLSYLEGKYNVNKSGTTCTLEISNAVDCDEGNYTLTLSNKSGSVTCTTVVRVVIKQWREVRWKRHDDMISRLKTFNVCNQVQLLNFLLYGPAGAGKSTIINSIKTISEGRIYVNCPTAPESSIIYHQYFESYKLENEDGSSPFAFYDVMGAEPEGGVNTQDIISALKGHMKEGYKFISDPPLSESDQYYNRNPSMSDQMHCLVYVIAADKISLMNNNMKQKWKTIRETASSMAFIDWTARLLTLWNSAGPFTQNLFLITDSVSCDPDL